MEYGSDPVTGAGTANAVIAARRPRRQYRQKIRALAYVNLDHANGGIIRDLSEAGIAVQAVSPLRTNQQVHLRFELLSPRIRVETAGRVVWADATGQAGVEFLDLPPRSRRLLKEWLFTQLLAMAHQAAWDSIFVHHGRGEEATELLFSASARPAIHLETEEVISPRLHREEGENQPEKLRLLWCPVPISPGSLARLVDGLILFSAMLLFSVVSLAMTGVFPAWPIALAIALGITSTFALLYWFLFGIWIGATPGTYLARLASSDTANGMYPEEEERPRFR